jgi:hypothetical protein
MGAWAKGTVTRYYLWEEAPRVSLMTKIEGSGLLAATMCLAFTDTGDKLTHVLRLKTVPNLSL